MAGGMRIDPKELPLPLREQVGVKILAELAKATPVAGLPEKRAAQKVNVRRLRFPSEGALARYYALKNVAKDGDITDLVLLMQDEKVIAVNYRIPTSSNFWSSGTNAICLSNDSFQEEFDERT